MSAREPQITILCCRYCGHIPMELAGIERAQYPASVKVVELPCTGGVSVLHLLKALEGGADGVLVTACPDGNCHHLSGNKRATLRVAQARDVLEAAGLAPERFRIVQIGIGHAQTFAGIVRDMTDRVRELGPVGRRAGAPQAGQ